MFRAFGLLIFFAAFPLSSYAQLDSRSMNCVDAVNLVAAKQSVVMSYAEGRAGLFVKNYEQCAQGHLAVVALVPTLDRAYCHVGYRCGDPIVTEGSESPSTESNPSGDDRGGGGVTVGGASVAVPPQK